MNIGVNRDIDPRVVAFYDTYYDIVDTPDFNNRTRLLKPEHGIRKIGYQKNKKCRFCHKSEPEVSFKKIAHVFPESIGNKALASYYECDNCNDHFGKTIENDYGNFFQYYHSVAGIRGKRGITKIKSKTGVFDPDGNFIPDYEMYWEPIDGEQGELCLKMISNIPIEERQTCPDTIQLEEIHPDCCPIGVFRALVKMAISVMPFNELFLFDHTIQWLLDTHNSNIFSPKKLLVRYAMIPGFNVVKYPHFVLYRRKRDIISSMPYMVFSLTYGLFSLMVEIPRNNEKNTVDISSIPFPPIPFHTSTKGCWDLSNETLEEDFKHGIELHLDNIKDISKKTTISMENGRRVIKFIDT